MYHLRVPPFLFGVFCTSLLATKLVLLAIHAPTVRTSDFLLFLPTFFLSDFAAICGARILLMPGKGYASAGLAILSILAVIVAGAAASQLGFFYETGGELDWHEASTYALDKEALAVLLSGSGTVLAAGCLILLASACLHGFFFRVTGDFVAATAATIASAWQWARDRFTRHDGLAIFGGTSGAAGYLQRRNSSIEDAADSKEPLLGDAEMGDYCSPPSLLQLETYIFARACSPATAIKVVASLFVAVSLIIRPPVPFNHMSVTLPASLLDVFQPRTSSTSSLDCFELSRQKFENAWPFPETIARDKWRRAKGDFKGWAPGLDSPLAKKYRNRVPEWVVENMPHGFQRWEFKAESPDPDPAYHNSSSDSTPGPECPEEDLGATFYNPVDDPMKISNLDSDVLLPLRDTLKGVKIKHVVLILMESLRAELFPMRKDSLFYDMIMEANKAGNAEEINKRLAYLTPNIDSITGGIGGFDHSQESVDFPRNWNDQTEPGFGGINVVGAVTASTLSTKSFAANLCGAWPLAVQNFDEADTESYQPCLPQIMSLLNKNKVDAKNSKRSDESASEEPDFRDMTWRTALLESMTETFDRQDRFDKKLGWDKVLAIKELEDDASRYKPSDPLYKKLGYLGFAEPVLEPYIRDFIANSNAEQQRMFMMHFTSSTHHPWELPSWFNTTEYLPNDSHQSLNKYLNTIRFHDYWIGQMMGIFDEAGITNETLVVFAGDHGQAFAEDNKKQGTYENGHISNFRIPITFRHPHLPRIQYEANATSISILPTILDLLINTGSLNKQDSGIASDLLQDYEGQSILRPYRPSRDGRRAWNFSIVNSGASMLGITSADTHWRMVLPLSDKFEFKMSDLLKDPTETDVVSSWSLSGLVSHARRKYGDEAAEWAVQAEAVAQWWMLERKRLWRHA